ncbi:GTPase Era [Rhodothermus marinus]|uniref:GTPase Era n=1 Tax=Rhodothermus marinus TaxID=29549 RepID=UPI0012BA4DA8|nr:GTPase Era [Rhodothermus marinus]BBM68405.1 GTPase Era [Rhodothermus marinus]BBM71374.1 GTPase Era [Rhodothermus marinus]
MEPEKTPSQPSLLIDPSQLPPEHRSGYVAIVGKPNVGKSTLMNALLGHKLSIVTPKPQTTRHRILGILSGDTYQIVFLDTPGVLKKARYKLHEHMLRTVDRAVADADLVLFMAEATQKTPDTISLSHLGNRPAILALNKMDLVRNQEQVLPLVDAYMKQYPFEAVVPISALTGYNLDVLLKEIIHRLPPGPPFYPKDQLSEHPERFFVAEIIREKIFEQFREEIPYAAQVNIVDYKERPEGKDFIDAEIIVERPTQKAILIGKGGQALKRLGTAARQEIEAFLGRPVYLQLHVKVREDWRNRDRLLRSYGY